MKRVILPTSESKKSSPTKKSAAKPKASSGEDVMSVFVNRLRQPYSSDMAAGANWQDVTPGSSEDAPLDFDEVVVEDTAPMRADPREMLMRLQEGAQKPVPSNDYTPAREQIISQMNRSIGMGANRPNMDDIERRLMEIEKNDSATVGDYFTAIAPMVAGTLLAGLPGGAGAGKGTVEALRYDQERADKKKAAKADILKGAAKSRIDLYKADQDALMNRFQMLGEIDKRLENLQRGTPEFESLLKQRQAFAQANIDMMKSLGMSEKDFEEAAFMKNWDIEADLAKQIAAHEQQAKLLEARGRQQEAAQERLFKQQKELELMRQQGEDRRAKMAAEKKRSAGAAKPGSMAKMSFGKLSVPMQKVVEKTSTQIAATMPLLNALKETLATVKDTRLKPEIRANAGENAAKILNSISVGNPDAVGVEEAKRLTPYFTYQKFNIPGAFGGAGSFIGYDLEGGADALEVVIENTENNIRQQMNIVNKAYEDAGESAPMVPEQFMIPQEASPRNKITQKKYDLTPEEEVKVEQRLRELRRQKDVPLAPVR